MLRIRPRIAVTRHLPAEVEARLARVFDAALNPDDVVLDRAGLLARAAGADGLLVCLTDRLDGELMRALPESVRIIATFSVGFEHIDLEAARARGIVVTNTPDVLTEATADIALLLMLGAARRANEGQAMLREGRWGAWTPTFMLGTHLGGKRLGLVGLGRIGRAFARRARACGMEIHYHGPRRQPADVEEGAVFHSRLDDLLAVSDVLSLHAPSRPETRNLIDAAALAHLPTGAILVNTARGDLVDDGALIDALRSGRLRAAGLDVFRGEPRIDPRYATLPNAFLLPHLGSATEETRGAMGHRCIDNLEAYFGDRPPPDRIA
jgi:glyoxylate reductase